MADTRATTWRQRLRECEHDSHQPPSRVTWLRRVYARLYRFLIARYGDWPADEPAASSAMPFVDATAPLAGKAARPVGELQTALKHIHAAQPAQPPRAKEDKSAPIWITVVQHSERVNLAACRKLLLAHGLEVQILRQGTYRLLQVPLHDRDAAFALLAAHRHQLRVPAQIVHKRRESFHRLIMLLGGGLAFAVGWLGMGVLLLSEAMYPWYALVLLAGMLAVAMGFGFAWLIRRFAMY